MKKQLLSLICAASVTGLGVGSGEMAALAQDVPQGQPGQTA